MLSGFSSARGGAQGGLNISLSSAIPNPRQVLCRLLVKVSTTCLVVSKHCEPLRTKTNFFSQSLGWSVDWSMRDWMPWLQKRNKAFNELECRDLRPLPIRIRVGAKRVRARRGRKWRPVIPQGAGTLSVKGSSAVLSLTARSTSTHKHIKKKTEQERTKGQPDRDGAENKHD